MISHENCLNLILEKVPEFEPTWRAHLEYWGDDEAGLSNDISKFASYVKDNIESLPNEKKKNIFALVEACLIDGDDAVKNAIATCFLENLLNAVSGERIEAGSFVNFLGSESREFCKSWDRFTGVNTPGL